MELSIVQQWKQSIHGEAQGASPDGHYLQLLSLTPQEFLDKDYGDEYATGLADGSISMELVNTYERGDYDLALPMTSHLRVFQRAWKNKHRHIKLARENRMTCLSELRSCQWEEDKGRSDTYKFVLCRIDGMPALESCEDEEEAPNTDEDDSDYNPDTDSDFSTDSDNESDFSTDSDNESDFSTDSESDDENYNYNPALNIDSNSIEYVYIPHIMP
jgi:hypothetical protein